MNRLQLLSHGNIPFNNLREAIIWLLKLRTEKIHLLPIIKKHHSDDEGENNENENTHDTTSNNINQLAILRKKLLPVEEDIISNIIFTKLPIVLLDIIFGKFLTLKETIAISQVDRDGFIYVYDNNDIDGPWKNLSYFDQSSVLLQPFRKESKIKLQFWRFEFLKRYLFKLSEIRRHHRKRGRGMWNGEYVSFWNSLPEMGRELLKRCKIHKAGIEDLRKPYGGVSIVFDVPVSGQEACKWLEKHEPYASATFSCSYNNERFAMDFADCEYLGIRYEDKDHYEERLEVEEEFHESINRLKKQIVKTKRKNKKGKRRRRRKVKKGRKEYKLLRKETREVWDHLFELENTLPGVIRPDRHKPKILGNKNPWPKKRQRRRKRKKKGWIDAGAKTQPVDDHYDDEGILLDSIVDGKIFPVVETTTSSLFGAATI